MRKRYIQCRKTGNLIPEEEYYAEQNEINAPFIINDIEPFQSIATSDRAVISSRSQMREYCKKHGLVPAQEVEGLPLRQMNSPYQRDRKGVIEALKRAMDY